MVLVFNPFGSLFGLNQILVCNCESKTLCQFMRIPSGIFDAVKLMKCRHFTIGSPYDSAYLVFFRSSQLSLQVFAKHGFASVY